MSTPVGKVVVVLSVAGSMASDACALDRTGTNCPTLLQPKRTFTSAALPSHCPTMLGAKSMWLCGIGIGAGGGEPEGADGPLPLANHTISL